MASLVPRLRRNADRQLELTRKASATLVKNEGRGLWRKERKNLLGVRKEALAMVRGLGGDVGNPLHVYGCYEIQFGQYRDMTYKWILENDPGWAAFLVIGMEKDKEEEDDRSEHKKAFKHYVMELLPDGSGNELVQRKKALDRRVNRPNLQASQRRTQTTVKKPSPASNRQTSQGPMPRSASGTWSDNDDDDLLLAAAQEMEQQSMMKGTGKQATPSLPVVSPRNVVPTVAQQQSAMLSGAPVKQLSSSRIRKPTTVTTSDTSHEVFRFLQPLPARMNVLEKEDISLICKVNQTEKFARWFFGDQELDNLGRITIVTGGQWHKLIIREAGPDDEDKTRYEGNFTVTIDSLTSVCDVYIKDLCLPERWKNNLPRADREWVARALFSPKQKKGAELKKETESQLWWYPPQPTAGFNYQPVVERYFARPLLLWMPRKQWKFVFHCPIPACDRRELASSGLNQKVRRVIDVDGFYNMACEQLQCASCGKRFLTWSHELLSQLDIGHRLQFPCILTAKHACDMKVVRLLRNRGLGNSCTQIRKKLQEEHAEQWDQVFLQYLTDCDSFASAAVQNLLPQPVFPDPLNKNEKLPLPRWFMQIYIQDVLHRLDELKASITSMFGKVLKLDSTRKVAKKLSGEAKNTALWSTNIGNEDGQVLMSVLTTGEGHALNDMIVGLIQRYRTAGRDPPKALYVDRDCCDKNSHLFTALRKAGWDTLVRLDIWHFMRRIASGCTTESHQLYSSFMGYLSNCIFIWNEEDLKNLIESKKAELHLQGESPRTDEELMTRLSRYELARHCRRKTRGAAETERLIDELIEAYKGEKGRDTLGVPLINTSRMDSQWKKARKHIQCIQDPPTEANALFISMISVL